MQIKEVLTKQDKEEFIIFPKNYIKEILSGYVSSIPGLNLFSILQPTIHSDMVKQYDGYSKMTMI